ncbi:MAG: cytochrome c, partial [Acidobacteriota bacterium]|nr:cytochrome c [Acidobacteriota bacterium]
MFRSLFFGASVLCLAALTASAQNPSPAAGAAQTKPVTEGGTQNAPPPAGKAQDTRVPVRRPAGGGDQGPTFDPATVERGKNIFQSNCSFCHGANAKGGESGPDLLRSVLVLHDENGDKIGPVIHNGRIDKGMPKFALSDEQIS